MGTVEILPFARPRHREPAVELAAAATVAILLAAIVVGGLIFIDQLARLP